MCGEALKVLFVASKAEAFAERPLLLGRWFDANTVQEMFSLPFADIIIIANLYLLCLALAEEQGSATPEIVFVHTERGKLAKLYCPGPSRHTSPSLKVAGLLYGNLQSFTSLVNPGKRHCWLLSLSTACCLLELFHMC